MSLGKTPGDGLTDRICFLFNSIEIRLTEAGPGETLLDFLRLGRRLTGTKEYWAQGDCGACTVLVGRLHEGRLRDERPHGRPSGRLRQPRLLSATSDGLPVRLNS